MASGKNKLKAQYEQQSQQQQQVQQGAQTPLQQGSVFENLLGDQFKKFNSWIGGKDYRDPTKGGLPAVRMGQLAQQNRYEETPTGLAGIAGTGGNATALGMARDNRRDHQNENAAINYEDQIVGRDEAMRGLGLNLNNSFLGRNQGLLGQSSSNFFNAMQGQERLSQSILPQLLSSIIGGAATVGGAYLGRPR